MGKGQIAACSEPPSTRPAAIFLRLLELTDHVAARQRGGAGVATPLWAGTRRGGAWAGPRAGPERLLAPAGAVQGR